MLSTKVLNTFFKVLQWPSNRPNFAYQVLPDTVRRLHAAGKRIRVKDKLAWEHRSDAVVRRLRVTDLKEKARLCLQIVYSLKKKN